MVPPQGQQRVLEELHAGHPGVARMKGLSRTIVWWPGLDGDIERKIQGCSSCQQTRNAPPKAPLHPWSWPHQLWMRVHVDYGGPLLGKMFLVLINALEVDGSRTCRISDDENYGRKVKKFSQLMEFLKNWYQTMDQYSPVKSLPIL